MQNFVQTRPIVPANIDPRAAPQPPPAPPPAAAPPPEDREAHQALMNEVCLIFCFYEYALIDAYFIDHSAL